MRIWLGSVQSSRIDTKGRFYFYDVPSGDYEIVVSQSKVIIENVRVVVEGESFRSFSINGESLDQKVFNNELFVREKVHQQTSKDIP